MGKITHGMTKTKPHWVWQAMKQRCLNPSHKAYKNYGGRGITVCKRWEKSFTAYYQDVGSKPFKYASVDRIDNNGGYWCGKCEECINNGWPKNWRWSTPSEQRFNSRDSGINARGFIKDEKSYRAQIKLNGKVRYLGLYKTKEEASNVFSIAMLIREYVYLNK